MTRLTSVVMLLFIGFFSTAFSTPVYSAQCQAMLCFNGDGGMRSSRYADRCKDYKRQYQNCINRHGRGSGVCTDINVEKNCGCARMCSKAVCTKWNPRQCFKAHWR